MNIRIARKSTGLSQRRLAKTAGVSFRTVQLLEGETHDARISTLDKISEALGYGPKELSHSVELFFNSAPNSIRSVSRKALSQPSKWKLDLFNFVDAFRRTPNVALIEQPPLATLEHKLRALFASVTELLCEELGLAAPTWCDEVPSLLEPWFLAGIENLKPMALVESPLHMRKRNIFVLENFLARA